MKLAFVNSACKIPGHHTSETKFANYTAFAASLFCIVELTETFLLFPSAIFFRNLWYFIVAFWILLCNFTFCFFFLYFFHVISLYKII